MGEPFLVGVRVVGVYGNEHLLGNTERRLVAIHLFHDAIDESARGEIFDLVEHETLTSNNAALAHKEHLHGRFEFVFGQTNDIDVFAALGNHLLLLDGALHCGPAVSQPGGALELKFFRSGAHVGFKLLHDLVGVAIKKVAELGHLLEVLGLFDVANARPAALLDVEQQAWAAESLVLVELAVAARANGEATQQQVERVANGIGVGIRTEVAHALALAATHHQRSGPLFVHRHRKKRIALVVAQSNVETRAMLFDEAELEHQRFDFVAHLNPLDGLGRGHHLRGAGVHVARILEVVTQPLTQVRGLAHIDNPTLAVFELIRPGCFGDRSGRRALHHDLLSLRGTCHSRRCLAKSDH